MPVSYPLGTRGKVIGQPYQGTHTLGNWQSDNAIDIAVPVGTPVYAVTGGTIGKRIGALGKGGRFAGLRVYVEGGGNQFYYAHLSKLAVKAGQHVRPGQLIGYSGSANGVAHLHFASKTGDPNAVLSGELPDSTATPQPPAETPAAVMPTDEAAPITPPAAVPPPTALGVAPVGPELPGSQNYTLDPRQVAETWSSLAADPFSSDETKAWAQRAALAAGG